MQEFAVFTQLLFTVIIGMYFLTRMHAENENERHIKEEAKFEAEKLNKLRHIRLSDPITEVARPAKYSDIIGQDDGMRALRSALWGANPQHVLIYGPPGVGKTAAARIVLDEVKNSPDTPFFKDAVFLEADASIMRCDERGFADPLIGSVHDPIYQGAGAMGVNGIPQPRAGAVTKAHGGILFLDEIGELPNEEMNKLLKVLEDRRVLFESSYYSRGNKKIPPYIHDIFLNGMPADFRLVGATTRKPSEIPEAIRSRCAEVFFNKLSFDDLVRIVKNAAARFGAKLADGVCECIADYSAGGRDAVKLLQSALNLSEMDGRQEVSLSDTLWVISAGRYKRQTNIAPSEDTRITGIRLYREYD